MTKKNLTASWAALFERLEIYGKNIFILPSYLFLDELCEMLLCKEITANDFECVLASTQRTDSRYKTVALSYAFLLYNTTIEPIPSDIVYKYFKLLDTVLIICGPDSKVVEVINESRILLQRSSMADFTIYNTFDELPYSSELPLLTNELETINDPSVRIFQNCMKSPIVIKGLASNWPALEKWNRPSFWIETAGHRFFPVEIGRHYLDDSWTQDIIQLNVFFDRYLFNADNEEIAYIAQHNWTHQIPLLAYDFQIPDLCEIFINTAMNSVITHMWFGDMGTFTPLHYDKYNNILTQIVGRKYILLVDPKFSDFFSSDNDNTSKIVDENISDQLKKHNIPFKEVILHAGESLLIPSKWWHQVKSLSFSISISFWF